MSARTPVLSALLAFGLVTAGIPADSGAEEFAPKARGIEGYEAVWKRSPFIVETVAVQTTLGLAGKFSLAGMSMMAGKPTVFLVDKMNSDPAKNRILVVKGSPGEQGIELLSVTMDSDPRKSSAKVRQGGQEATLVFEMASLAPPGQNIAPGAVPPPPSGMIRQLPMPAAPAQPGVVPPGSPNAAIPSPPTPSRRIIRPAPVNLSP